MKTPSEEIEEIRTTLIRNDWVKFGGNKYDKESWQAMCEQESRYMYRAILQFLDKHQNPFTAFA